MQSYRDTVNVALRLVCTVRHDEERSGESWIAICPALDVVSQGETEEDAKRCLTEALELWVESCLERFTLDEALREMKFRRATHDEEIPSEVDGVNVTRTEESVEAPEGSFPVDLMIPAYQAASFLAGHQ